MESVEAIGSKMSLLQNRSAPSGCMCAVRIAAKAVDCDSRYVIVVVVVTGKPWFCPEQDGPRHGSGVGAVGHRPQGRTPSGLTSVWVRAICGLLELSFCVNVVNEKNV